MVVLPLHRTFGTGILSRPLLYTAITRAKALLVVIGSRDVLGAAVARTQDGRARTRLTHRLAHAAAHAGLQPCEPAVFRDADGGGGSIEGATDDDTLLS